MKRSTQLRSAEELGLTEEELAGQVALSEELLAEIVTEERVEKRKRYCVCHCCGASFYTDKPQDPERDTGFGTCAECHPRVAASWVKHGFPGERPITLTEANARLDKYA